MVYCSYDLCSPDTHCCGFNQCCSNDSFLRVYIGYDLLLIFLVSSSVRKKTIRYINEIFRAGISLFVLLILAWYLYRIRKNRVNVRKNVLVPRQNTGDTEPLIHPEDVKTIHMPVSNPCLSQYSMFYRKEVILMLSDLQVLIFGSLVTNML